MHTITDCPICGKDFMYHGTDTHLLREPMFNKKIQKEYPITDDTWPSRRWNIEKTEYMDLSGYSVVCQECDEVEGIAKFMKEKADHRGWDNAEYLAADKFGKDKTLEAIQWLAKNDVASEEGGRKESGGTSTTLSVTRDELHERTQEDIFVFDVKDEE